MSSRASAALLAGLGGEEEVLAVTRHPGRDTQLRVAVPRRRVDVVDAVTQQHFQRAVCLVLTCPGKRGRPEQRDCARVACPSEWSPFDHSLPFPQRVVFSIVRR